MSTFGPCHGRHDPTEEDELGAGDDEDEEETAGQEPEPKQKPQVRRQAPPGASGSVSHGHGGTQMTNEPHRPVSQRSTCPNLRRPPERGEDRVDLGVAGEGAAQVSLVERWGADGQA